MPTASNLKLNERLFVALDYPDAASALDMAKQLSPLGVSFKVGMELYYSAGIDIISRLKALDAAHSNNPVFVDLKLHDIPNTVAGAVRTLVRQGVNFLNVHAQGGPAMMRAAVEAARETAAQCNVPVPRLIAVTLLTSLTEQDLQNHLLVNSVELAEYVQHLAIQTQACGMDGVVCSAREAALIRKVCGPDFLLVTPGIRPAASDVQDQHRVITPQEAMRQGADYLVVGRPITNAADPRAAAENILSAMADALTPATQKAAE